MKASHLVTPIIAGFVLSLFGGGCSSDNTMTQKEIDAAKHAKPPTEAQMKNVWNSAATQAEKAKQEQRNWAKAHPDKVAEINAQRAKSHLPPLGE
jgi:hypothetical protein